MAVRRLGWGILLILLALGPAGEAVAEQRRLALVIGNGAYVHTTELPNAPNDGRAIAAKLRALDFEVLEGIDLDRRATETLIRDFSRQLDTAEVGLFFYAGHGMQVNGRNYLVPVDAVLETEADLDFETVRLDVILNQLERRPRTNIVLLDACRDNPLARTLSRNLGASRSAAVGRGLARIDGGIGTLIAYATEPDNVALDGDGANSPFTTALLQHIDTPGLEVRQMLTRVRQQVIAATDRRQVPWDHSSLTGDFFFRPEAAAPAQIAALPGRSAELSLWDAAQSVDPPEQKIEALQIYLDAYPDGTFARMAQVQTTALERQLAQADPNRGLAVQPASPEVGEEALGLTRDRRRAIQRSLTVLGFDTKGADGVFGPNSRRAIAAFQAAEGMDPSGYLDGPQLAILLEAAAPPLAEAERLEMAAQAEIGPGDRSRLAEVERWLYLLDSDLDRETVSRIAGSRHDMLVVDYLPSQQGSEDYPMAETVRRWHQAAHPKLVLAYINIGEAENYRTYWQPDWRIGNPEWIRGDDPDGWANNYPVAFWFDEWRAIWLGERGLLGRIVEAGFDGVYLDWIGAYDEESVASFALSDGADPKQEMIWWVGDIAETAQKLNPDFVIVPQNPGDLLTNADFLGAIDGVAQEHIWFDGGEDNEPAGGCRLPLRDADIGSAAYRQSLSAACRRYHDNPDGTLHSSSERYLPNLALVRDSGKAVFTVDYALDADDIAWVTDMARRQGFIPFVGSRALDRFQVPHD